MRAPSWWESRGIVSTALLPLASLHAAIGKLRRRRTMPMTMPVPVICVGNLVAGGAGKTPVCLELGELAQRTGTAAHFVTRGYGGALRGPVRVELDRHDHRAVGDEALLLARTLPCWVSRDRPTGIRAAADAGAELVIMDDGLQNPSVTPDFSILVIDGGYGFGNGRLIPAGPLRETWAAASARVDLAIVIGPDSRGAAAQLDDMAILAARIDASSKLELKGRNVLPFAGIGRPEKFFDSLRELGAVLREPTAFADHHPYLTAEIDNLKRRASAMEAALITTEKDFVRIPSSERAGIDALPIRLAWNDPRAEDQLGDMLRRVRGSHCVP